MSVSFAQVRVLRGSVVWYFSNVSLKYEERAGHGSRKYVGVLAG